MRSFLSRLTKLYYKRYTVDQLDWGELTFIEVWERFLKRSNLATILFPKSSFIARLK